MVVVMGAKAEIEGQRLSLPPKALSIGGLLFHIVEFAPDDMAILESHVASSRNATVEVRAKVVHGKAAIHIDIRNTTGITS